MEGSCDNELYLAATQLLRIWFLLCLHSLWRMRETLVWYAEQIDPLASASLGHRRHLSNFLLFSWFRYLAFMSIKVIALDGHSFTGLDVVSSSFLSWFSPSEKVVSSSSNSWTPVTFLGWLCFLGRLSCGLLWMFPSQGNSNGSVADCPLLASGTGR